MMRTKVVHCKREFFEVYIGRRNGNFPESPWHNPFHIGPDGSREQVIDKFRAYLLTHPDLMERIPLLRGKILGCWCQPSACHGDVLAEMANGEQSDNSEAAPAQADLF